MLNRMKIGIGALVVAGGGMLWATVPFAGDNEGELTVADARAVAYATEERVQNAWPVGGEWRYEASWASPQQLFSEQYDLWQRGIETCMTDAGFDYSPYAFVDSDAIYSQLNPLYEEGVSLGYEEPGQPDPEASSPNARQSQEFTNALLGEQGCANRSKAFAFSAPAADAFADMQGRLIASVDRALSGYATTPDAQVRAASWSLCMTSRGLDFGTPDDAQSEFRDDGVVSDQEVRVRRADYECDLASELTESRSKWETMAFTSWLDEHAADIGQLEELQAEAEREVGALNATLTEQGVAALPSIEVDRGETRASTLPN